VGATMKLGRWRDMPPWQRKFFVAFVSFSALWMTLGLIFGESKGDGTTADPAALAGDATADPTASPTETPAADPATATGGTTPDKSEANAAEGPCAVGTLGTYLEDDAFTPTVDFYTLEDDGTTLVLYARVDVVDDQHGVSWREEGSTVRTDVQVFGTPPTGPDYVLQEFRIGLDSPLGDRIVCYGAKELDLSVG